MQIKGEVHLILRDAKSEEIISEQRKTNIITEPMYQRLWEFNRIAPLSIVVTNAVMESSKFSRHWPGDGTNGIVTRFPDTFVPANGNWNQYTPPTETTDGLLQFAGRYNAPSLGTSRTINSVGLGGWGTGNAQSSIAYSAYDNALYLSQQYGDNYFPPIAFLKLTTPCIQTDLQVLDVYYRLYFPYDNLNSEVPFFLWKRLLDIWCTAAANYSNRGLISPFKIPTLKSYDSDKYQLSYQSYVSTSMSLVDWTPTLNNTNTPYQAKSFNYTDPNFTDNPGFIFTGLMWSNQGDFFSAYTNLSTSNKIGNLIGQAQLSTTSSASQFLDVDNLPTGTGKVYLGGTWNNTGTPSGSGLYYTSKFPEKNIIKITTTGAVGVSEYKFIKQRFFGLRTYTTSDAGPLYGRYNPQVIAPLCGSLIHSAPGNANNEWFDYNKTLIGDVTDTKFAGQQLSACERFDDSSIIIVKKDEILLYNIPAGDYWRYTAAYTNIHQVAVMNNKIYVACRNTGLWVIDPYNSLIVSSLSSPGSGIDLSQCHGVAKGFGNLVWAVGANCLASFNGTTWTKYDSTTTPAFNMTGVSDNNWSNIEFLKVDEENSDNQMLLVRKFNATSDSTLLGVWWSTVGVATNTGAETQSSGTQFGRPRLHRKHVAGLSGLWCVFSANTYRLMSFGTSTFSSIASPAGDAVTSATNSGTAAHLYSINFVKNTSNQTRLVLHRGATAVSGIFNNGGLYLYRYNTYLVDSTGAITDTLGFSSNSLTFLSQELGWTFDTGTYLFRTTTLGAYGGAYDQGHYIILCPGVMISIQNRANNGQFSQIAGSLVGGTIVRANIFGLSTASEGGPMSFVAREEYGWNGSQWILNNSSGRPTHTNAESLSDGVTVRFENGASGTSFVTPNLYTYTVAEGISKDNATRVNYNSTLYYYRKVYKNQTDLQSSTVPTNTAQSTGIVGVDFTRASSNVTVNVDNEVIFSGLNSRQYAIGDKEVTGDFVITVDPTNINAANVRNAAFVGVTRADYAYSGQPQFGWFTSAGRLYWFDNGALGEVSNPPSATTLLIRRTAGTLELVRNGTVERTHNNSAIRIADYRLSTMFGIWDFMVTTNYNGGIRCPKMTITSNGSDRAIYFGNPVTNTGSYNSRFCGVDAYSTGATTVTLNGTPATLKTDGTAPGPGQITIDPTRGIMYFNAADEGKTVAANYLYQASE